MPDIVAVLPEAILSVRVSDLPKPSQTMGPLALVVPGPPSVPPLHVYVPDTAMLSDPSIDPVSFNVVTEIASPLLKCTVPPTVSTAPSEVSVAPGLNVAVPLENVEAVVEL